MLDPCCLGIDRGIEVERPIDDAADDLSPVRHLGEDRPVERGWHFGAHRLHRRQHSHFRQAMPSARAKPIAFWQMSRF